MDRAGPPWDVSPRKARHTGGGSPATAVTGPGAASPVDDAACTRALLGPCLLLLLAEGSGHGYDLVRRLNVLGLAVEELSSVYYALKRMETEGLVASAWEASAGPARRVYELTADGQSALEAWSERLSDFGRLIARFGDRRRTPTG